MHVWYVCMYFHTCVGLKLTSDTFLDCFPFYLIEQGFALHPDLRILASLVSWFWGSPCAGFIDSFIPAWLLCGFWESKLWSSHSNSEHFIHWAISGAWHTIAFWLNIFLSVCQAYWDTVSLPPPLLHPPHSYCLLLSFLLYFLVFSLVWHVDNAGPFPPLGSFGRVWLCSCTLYPPVFSCRH